VDWDGTPARSTVIAPTPTAANMLPLMAQNVAGMGAPSQDASLGNEAIQDRHFVLALKGIHTMDPMVLTLLCSPVARTVSPWMKPASSIHDPMTAGLAR